MTEDETYCEHMTYQQTLETPAEYCENPTLPGEDFCEEHMPWEPGDFDPADDALFELDEMEPFE